MNPTILDLLGVPLPGQRLFFGDTLSAKAYDEALVRLTSLGAKIVEIDIEPFYAAARLLYDGPWVAERYLAVRTLIALAGFYFVSRGNWHRLLGCLVGFVTARILVTWFTRIHTEKITSITEGVGL